jgi:hypothetical protein
LEYNAHWRPEARIQQKYGISMGYLPAGAGLQPSTWEKIPQINPLAGNLPFEAGSKPRLQPSAIADCGLIWGENPLNPES